MTVENLRREFFERNPVICAREFIGCTLGLGRTRGIVVETEAYSELGDPACHTFKRPAARVFLAQHQAGSAYVYLNYGMHWLFNFLVKGGDRDGFVLIRALEPVKGIPVMKRRRKQAELSMLCNGPAKLTQALGIRGDLDGGNPLDMAGWTLLHPPTPVRISVSTRIGISKAAGYPWRFLLHGSRFVSMPA